MNDVSFFCIPKPFIGHNEIIQRNSLQSLLRLVPSDHIFIFGNENGADKVSQEYGINHIPDIRKTDLGTPLLSDAFFQIQQKTKTDYVCYLNADIILVSDFLKLIECIDKKKFLTVGRRWNINIDQLIDFSDNSESVLVDEVKKQGNLYSEFAIDYFLFPNGMIEEFPDFAVGRPGWDNWLIYNIRSKKIPVIDATYETTVIHQNHDYSHVPKARVKNSYEGQEADDNRKLIGSDECLFSINDSTHYIENGKIKIDFSMEKISSRIKHQNVLQKNKVLLFIIKFITFSFKRLIFILSR